MTSTKFEKLVRQIMDEAAADDEPVTREEAEEMAQMELKAQGISATTSDTKAKRKTSIKVRKVDEEKKLILSNVKTLIESMGAADASLKNEVELSFYYNSNSYSLKLVKHRG